MALAWAEFSERADLEQYKNLKRNFMRLLSRANWTQVAMNG